MKIKLFFKAHDTGFFLELNGYEGQVIPRIGEYVDMDCGFYVCGIEYRYFDSLVEVVVKLTTKIITIDNQTKCTET